MEYDLVLEGGGARGLAFVGALQDFEARGHTPKRILGVSGGAMIGALLAAGYTAEEMLGVFSERDDDIPVLSRFLDNPGPYPKDELLRSGALAPFRISEIVLPFLPDFVERKVENSVVEWFARDFSSSQYFSFLEYGGMFSNNYLISWMMRALNTGTYQGRPRAFGSMTLAEFQQATACSLTLIASDVTAGSMLVLNHLLTPDLPVVWAVILSMSIPVLWHQPVWRAEWGAYRGRDIAGHEIVDGSLLSDFPIELYVSKDTYVQNIMGADAGEKVLGLLVDDSQPVPGAENSTYTPPESATRAAPVVRRMASMFNLAMSTRDKNVNETVELMVARLPAKGYSATEFDMSDERRALLINAGREAMRDYFERAMSGMDFFGLGHEPGASRKAAPPPPTLGGHSFDLDGIGDQALSAEAVAELNQRAEVEATRAIERERKGSPFI